MTPKQCRAARMAVGLSAAALAEAASLKTQAVEWFEAGENMPARIQKQLQQALEAAGVEFMSENGDGGAIRLRQR